MAIQKRPTAKGITYRVTVTQRVNGKRQRYTSSFKTKREAKAWEVEQLEKLKSGVNYAHMKTNFSVLVDKWLKESVIHEKSNSTYRACDGDMRTHILPCYGSFKIAKLQKSHISEFRAELSNKNLSRASINRIMASFKSFIKYCIDHGYIIQNPFNGYKELKIQRQEKEFWDKNDIKNFIENGKDDYFYNLYLFALNTGLRIGEIGALNVSKINFNRNSILIDESLGKDGFGSVKNYEIRTVYMNKTVREIVKKQVIEKSPSDPVFQTRGGSRIYSGGFSSRTFIPYQNKLGIKNTISFHGLRHTFASHFLMNGGSIFDLQKLLGHKSINSTMVYAHLSQGHLKEVMENMQFNF